MPDEPEWALDQASTILNGLLSAHHIDIPANRWAHAQRYVARALIAARRAGRDEMRQGAPVISKYHGTRGFELERFIHDYAAWRALPLEEEPK